MLWNYLFVAWRTLVKNVLYSLINIGGLALGLCVCMLILLYVSHEHSYDSFHAHADRIFRVNGSVQFGGEPLFFEALSSGAAPLTKTADPRVEGFLRMETTNQPVPIQNKANPERLFTEKAFAFADSNFFSFFSFPLISGSPASVLQKPFSVVLSERAALKYFGDKDPVGQLLTYDHTYTLEVTGVAKDPPSNSTLQYDFIASIASIPAMDAFKESWLSGNVMEMGNTYTYLLLNHPEAAKGVEKTMDLLGTQSTQGPFSNGRYSLYLFRDTHLGLNFGDFSNIKYLRIFPLIAGLVLLLALINYMSLATAKATTRAKEIGVRKALGAGRPTVAFQFYIESALYAVLAFALGFGLFILVKPGFLSLLQLSIDDRFLLNPQVWCLFGALLIVTTLIAGSYPSLVLSSFNPVSTLSGKASRQRGGALIRRIFTVLQFTISVALIGSSLVMHQQIDFLRHADTGLQRANVLMIPFSKDLGKHYEAFRQEVAELPGVSQVATTYYPFYGMWMEGFVGGEGQQSPIPLNLLNASANFIDLMGIRWKYPPASVTELSSVNTIVLNEKAVGDLHLPENPVGQIISMDRRRIKIAGVVRNFNYISLEYALKGLGIVRDTMNEEGKPNTGCLYAKLNPGTNLPTLIDKIKTIDSHYESGVSFEYRFMDDAFDALYQSEDRLSDLLGVFTLLTIAIACLGLLGLAAFSAAQRTKEIGIRKVLGANVYTIVLILTTDFIYLVAISIVLAAPLGWWAMDHWLRNFEYRIPMRPWAFLIAGFGALVIALATVSALALKVAIRNPIDSLRTE